MKTGGHRFLSSSARDSAVDRRRNRGPYLRMAEDGGRHRLLSAHGGATRNHATNPRDVLSTSDPLPLSNQFHERTTDRKAASEPPTGRRFDQSPAQTSDKTDQSHLSPLQETQHTSYTLSPPRHPEYEIADVSEEPQSYTTASDEPDWTPHAGPVAACTEESGEQADSEPSDTEPDRRAWYCGRAACRRLNPASAPLCQHCAASRLEPEAGAGAGAAERAASDTCLLCHRAPADHSFLHGRAACRAACRPCALRRVRRGRPCPVCRRAIQQVITMLRC